MNEIYDQREASHEAKQNPKANQEPADDAIEKLLFETLQTMALAVHVQKHQKMSITVAEYDAAVNEWANLPECAKPPAEVIARQLDGCRHLWKAPFEGMWMFRSSSYRSLLEMDTSRDAA